MERSNSQPEKLRLRLRKSDEVKLSLSATLHCLLGCGIGEVVGMIISTILGLGNVSSIIISIVLGFIAGLALGILPLKRKGFSMQLALKTVVIAEGISIAVMEAFEVMTQVMIPGVIDAHLDDMHFWYGMFLSLAVGFIAALPVNYVMVKRGIRHIH